MRRRGQKIADAIAEGFDLAKAFFESTDWEQFGEDIAQLIINGIQKGWVKSANFLAGLFGVDENETKKFEKKIIQASAKYSNLLGFDETLITTSDGTTTFVPNDVILSTTATGTGGIEQSGGGRGGSRTINYNVVNYVQGNLDDAAQQKNDMINVNRLAALG